MSDEPNLADQEIMRLAIGETDEGGDTPGDDDAEKKVTTPAAGSDTDDDDARGEGDDADDDDDGEGEDDKRKTRSKRWKQRVDSLTARNYELQRRLDELEAKAAGKDKADAPAVPGRPDPADFEFGEADPSYTEALADWKITKALSDREKETESTTKALQEKQQVSEQINSGLARAEEQAKAKYEDFDARLAEAIDARGGEPLPAPLAIALSVSPVGGDLIYRLATDEGAAERLESLATGNGSLKAMALALGELEGEYVEDDGDADLDLDDELDMARMMGRMRARVKGAKASPAAVERKKEVRPTNAPEPPQQRVRGGSGRFEVGDDTDDFAAFEAKIMGGKK